MLPILNRHGKLAAVTSRRAWGSSEEALAAMLGGTAPSADLGGSSKYSSEILED